MAKNKFTLLCGKCDFEIPEAVSLIKCYYSKHPNFFLYDFNFNLKTQRRNYYKLCISKASVLGLQHIKPKAWAIFERWLNQTYKKNTPTYQIVNLFTHTRGKTKKLKGIDKTTFTKTLHILRPGKMPIVDDKIEKAVKETACYKKLIKENRNDLLAVCKIIINDVKKKENHDSLEEICKQINKEYLDLKITPLRAWDILVWSSLPPKQTKNQRK